MPARLQPRRWLLLAVSAAAIAALSVLAMGSAPQPGVLGHLRGFSSLDSQVVPKMGDRWAMHLRFDASVPAPGPRWVINDSAHAGEGHELEWQAPSRSLLLYRAQDRFLLGAVRLPSMPQTIDLVRAGAWYRVSGDGHELLACLDPLAHGEAAAPGWGIQVDAGTMGDAELTLIDERRAGASDAAEDAAVEAVRQLLSVGDTVLTPAVETLVGAATGALAALPEGAESQRRLRHWLALALARLALAQDEAGPERARDAAAQLALLARLDPVPESAGMLISLLPDLAERVRWRPTVSYPAETVLRRRAGWLQVLGEDALAAIDASPPAAGDDLVYELRLVAHAAGCLQSSLASQARDGSGGVEPRPVPAEAPPFVVARWRAFAASDPGGTGLPDPPPEWRSGPVPQAIDELVADAVLVPASALTLCGSVRSLMQALAAPIDSTSAAELAECRHAEAAAAERAPRREAALTQALLALRGVGTRESACQALVATYGEESPLAQHDPLAYALLSLLLRSDASLIDEVPVAMRAPAGIGAGWSPVDAGASQLRPQERSTPAWLLKLPKDLKELENVAPLLSGEDAATAQAWRMQSADLPPVQALAAALAMQQVRLPADTLHSPRWDLLGDLPSYTLPLELLLPPGGPPASGAAGGSLLP